MAMVVICGLLNYLTIGCYDKHLYCLQAFTGDVMYKHLTGDVIKSTPAVDSGRVYFGSHDHHFYCLSLVCLALVKHG